MNLACRIMKGTKSILLSEIFEESNKPMQSCLMSFKMVSCAIFQICKKMQIKGHLNTGSPSEALLESQLNKGCSRSVKWCCKSEIWILQCSNRMICAKFSEMMLLSIVCSSAT